MAFQNIGASNKDDAFYRYKMPRMLTKIEGRGNGIKTNIVNMVDIAKALARPASYTTKYFGCELGAQSKFDEKTGVSLVNGAHDTGKLAQLLEHFIKRYVQCYGCGNPETEVIITKNQTVNLNCVACGFVSNVDMRDKLTTFILKNPPEQKKGSKDKKTMRRAEKERLKEGEAADEEQRKLKKDVKKKTVSSSKDGASSKVSAAKKKAGGSSDEDHLSSPRSQAGDTEVADGDEGDVQWHTDTSAEAAQKRILEQLSAVTAEMVMISTIEPDQEKKPKPKKEAAKSGTQPEVKAEVPRSAQNGKHISPHDALVKKVKDQLKRGCSPSELQSFLLSLSGSPQEVMTALLDALFDGVGKGFVKEVGKQLKYLSVAVQDEASQKLLLQSLEAFCAKAKPDSLKEVSLVLKLLYDEDVLEEELIVQWYNKGAAGDTKSSQLWKIVKPFVEWVQNAESETEEE